MCTIWFLWCVWFLMVAINFYGTEANTSPGKNVRLSQQKDSRIRHITSYSSALGSITNDFLYYIKTPNTINTDAATTDFDAAIKFKCKDYIWEMRNRPQISEKQENDRSSITYTGRRQSHNRTKIIFGVSKGKKTGAMEYPHMAALGWYSLLKRDWVFQCGASLISANFLLTAAHCTKVSKRFLNNYDTLEPKIVRLGARNIRHSKNEMYHDFNITEIMVYEKYMPPYKNYDIALLKLSEQVTFTKFIQPACLGLLPRGKTAMNKKYTVTGWGSVNNVIKMVDDLRYGEVDLFDQKKCDSYTVPYRSRNWNKTAPHQICAGKMDGSTDTCNGDSGGPLQYKLLTTKNEGTMHAVIGITSFGSIKCAQKNVAAIYTKVEYFIPWIENIVWPAGTGANIDINAYNTTYSLIERVHFKN